MLTSLASWSRNQGEAQPDNSPRHFQKHVQLLVQLNISAGCGHACWVSEVKFVVSLKTMAIQCFFLYRSWQCLLEKKCPALKICRYPTVQIHLATAANEAFVCDCYRNMGHFLCSVERIKSFVNVHLHCIVSNVPSKGRKYPGPPELLRSEISFSRTCTCNIPKQWKSTQTRRYLKEMCILFVFW